MFSHDAFLLIRDHGTQEVAIRHSTTSRWAFAHLRQHLVLAATPDYIPCWAERYLNEPEYAVTLRALRLIANPILPELTLTYTASRHLMLLLSLFLWKVGIPRGIGAQTSLCFAYLLRAVCPSFKQANLPPLQLILPQTQPLLPPHIICMYRELSGSTGANVALSLAELIQLSEFLHHRPELVNPSAQPYLLKLRKSLTLYVRVANRLNGYRL